MAACLARQGGQMQHACAACCCHRFGKHHRQCRCLILICFGVHIAGYVALAGEAGDSHSGGVVTSVEATIADVFVLLFFIEALMNIATPTTAPNVKTLAITAAQHGKLPLLCLFVTALAVLSRRRLPLLRIADARTLPLRAIDCELCSCHWVCVDGIVVLV